MKNADVCRGVWRIKDLFWHLIVQSGGDRFTTLSRRALYPFWIFWFLLIGKNQKGDSVVPGQSAECVLCIRGSFFDTFSHGREKHAYARTSTLDCASKSERLVNAENLTITF